MPKKESRAASLKKTKQSLQKKATVNHLLRDKIIGLFFVCAALFLLTFHLPPAKSDTHNPIQINPKLLNLKLTENIPVRILIPKVNIDTRVIAAKIVDGYWELSEKTASWGEGSGLPGTKNNTVIFAHTREGLFYNLKDVKTGDIVYVFSKNKWFRYKVNKITVVFPNQIDVIQPTKNETLTLYTCTGYYDEKRLIVQALPQQ